jgi:hypothetical protein
MPKTVGYSQAEVVCEIIKQYIPANSLVLDCTYGQGLFWDSLLTPGLRLVKSDLQKWQGIDAQADFTRLPFRDAVFSAVFFDPPYVHPGVKTKTLVKHFATANVEYLYAAGTLEIWRVLKPQGLLIMKCGGGLSNLMPIVQSLQLLYRLEHEFILTTASNIFQRLGQLQNLHAYFVAMRKRGKAQ